MATQIPRVIADLELQLSTAVSVGATSFTLSSSNDDDGEALPAGLYVFSVDSGTSNKEYILGQLNGVNITAVKSVSRQGVQTSGAVRAHRVGAPVILTNFAALQLVADTLRGQVNLDGSNPLSYDTAPTLSDGKELATVQYVIDTAAGGTVAFDSQVITGVAGEAVVEGNLVYFKTSDQEWYLTDADTASTIEGVQLGIAKGTGSDGVGIAGGIQISGTYTTTGLTAGSLYYAGNTVGTYTTTEGTTKQVIGVALSTTKLLIIPRNPQTPTTLQKDALAGGGDFGTPSASNKFLTEEWNASASGAPQIITFTTSGTWTKDAGLKYVVVEVIGGGGAGGGSVDTTNRESGNGGGGGGYSKKVILSSSFGSTETVTIGAGGVGAVALVGGTGGTSSFGTHTSATGGTGGDVGAEKYAGSGGIGSGGDVNVAGNTGTRGVFNSSGDDVGGGSGGGTVLGGGGLGTRTSGVGATGRAYGGGGAGSYTTGGDHAGGAGAPGAVIVTEYYS